MAATREWPENKFAFIKACGELRLSRYQICGPRNGGLFPPKALQGLWAPGPRTKPNKILRKQQTRYRSAV